jgi:hypothetical protein
MLDVKRGALSRFVLVKQTADDAAGDGVTNEEEMDDAE